MGKYTMDPLSITTAILSITKKCCKTASVLHEIRTKHKDAPTTITSICSQTTVISASLSQLQYLVLRKIDLSAVMERRPDLAAALDCSMIGCVMLFSCLDDEIARVTKIGQSGNFNWRGKARISWNQETLRQMLEDLRSQQAALSTLINLLQVDSFAELKSLLERNKSTFEDTVRRTHTLRKSNPNVKIRKSIYVKEDDMSEDSFTIAPSTPPDEANPNQPSELHFDFEDLVQNSRVYQQMLAEKKLTENARRTSIIEGDLIDFSDDVVEHAEIQQDSEDAAAKELRELIIANHDEDGDGDEDPVVVELRRAFGQTPPKLELPDDISKSLDISRTSASDEPDSGQEIPTPPPLADEVSVDDDSDDASVYSDPPEMIAAQKQVRTFSMYDPVLFETPIPDDRPGEPFTFDITPATPLDNVEMHFEDEPDPSVRAELPSPDAGPGTRSSQTSSTSSRSFQSRSSRSPDKRRQTSSFEVEHPEKSTPAPTPCIPVLNPGALYSRSNSSERKLRRQQTSPTPSTSNQNTSYYGREKHQQLSNEVYPRPQTQQNPSSQSLGTDAAAKRDTSPSSSSSRPNTSSKNTLRKPFFRRRKSSATQHCYRCKGPLTGSFITAMGVSFHNGCFRCADCNKILEGTAFPFKRTLEDGTQETIPLCEMDYFQRLDPICRKCGNPLCESFMGAFEGGRDKTLERFSCGGCGKVFVQPYSYFRDEGTGKVYC